MNQNYVNQNVRWPITPAQKQKRNTANKENLTNKTFLLPYKQDLLAYTKKDLLTNTKKPRQKATANFTAKSCDKFPRENAVANSRGN